MYEELNPGEFVRRRAADANWQLLDVREGWEVERAAVEGALHVPLGEIAVRYKELDTDRPVAVLCHSGGRSARAAQFLATLEFPAVANIVGGIDAWSVEVDAAIARY